MTLLLYALAGAIGAVTLVVLAVGGLVRAMDYVVRKMVALLESLGVLYRTAQRLPWRRRQRHLREG